MISKKSETLRDTDSAHSPASPAQRSSPSRLSSVAALAANVLILGIIAWAWVHEAWFYDSYYRVVQEDEAMEWATFWAFFAAAGTFVIAAVRQKKALRRL